MVGLAKYALSSAQRAVMWQGGSITPLPDGDAYDINNVGEIVGYDNAGGAFYWFNGQLKKLPPLAAGLRAGAQAINENGDVVGWGYDHSQSQHAVLWTHVR
jgi:probable HAF family extracellular repeat protein